MEGIDQVVDFEDWSTIVSTVLSLILLVLSSEGISASDIDVIFTLGDHSGLDLSDNITVSHLDLVRVWEEFLAAKDVLENFHFGFFQQLL